MISMAMACHAQTYAPMGFWPGRVLQYQGNRRLLGWNLAHGVIEEQSSHVFPVKGSSKCETPGCTTNFGSFQLIPTHVSCHCSFLRVNSLDSKFDSWPSLLQDCPTKISNQGFAPPKRQTNRFSHTNPHFLGRTLKTSPV